MRFRIHARKRRRIGRQRFLAAFVSGQYIRLKNLSAAVNATKSATRILLRGRAVEPKVKFSLHKNCLI